MSTTTSTQNSGLLDVLLTAFKEKTGITVHVIAVGSGKALRLAENGDVDLVLSHAPEAELEFINNGSGVDRKPVMYNDFVIAGPRSDPAGIKKETSAATAFGKIASGRFEFVSRADESGTDKKEKAIWKSTGVFPAGAWYIQAGQGMEEVLIMAHEKQAYTLSDRGTFIAVEDKIECIVLCEGDPLLHNPYTVMAVNPKKHPDVKYAEAKKFIVWITSDEGRAKIGGFRIKGVQLFHPVTGNQGGNTP